MQVSKINSVTFTPYKQATPNKKQNTQIINQAQDLSFEGVGFNKAGKWILGTRDLEMWEAFFNDIFHDLQISRKSLKPYFRLDRKDRTDFFYDLTEALHKDLFEQRTLMEPEQSLEVLDGIYQAVKNPNRTHMSIVRNPNFTFEEKSKLLMLTAENGTPAELFNKLRHTPKIENNSQNIEWPAETYVSLLTSPNAEKLNKEFSTYKDYIRLNHKEPTFLENLNKELERETPSFNTQQLVRKAILEEYDHTSQIIHSLGQDELLKNWNPEGLELMDNNFLHSFHKTSREGQFNEENLTFYKTLFNSTTKENLAFRKTFFENQYLKTCEEDSNSSILNFLERAEKDENIRTLYQEAIDTDSNILRKPLNELLFYADSIGSDVLTKKMDKFFEIIDSTTAEPDEMVQILHKNLNNKFYLSQRSLRNLRDDETDIRNSNLYFPETKAQIHRLKRKFKYNFLPKVFGTGKEVPLKMEVSFQEYSDAISKAPAKDLSKAAQKIAKPMEISTTKPVIKRDYKAEYKVRKLKIQQEAQEIIRSRMKSAKQIKEQSPVYDKKATKMRNQFLNEMFNSVAETRAQQRAKGQKPTVSNADVIEIYQKINGKNKKLFKYLLTSRTENGEREFDLKQIGEILDEVAKNRPPKINQSEKDGTFIRKAA